MFGPPSWTRWQCDRDCLRRRYNRCPAKSTEPCPDYAGMDGILEMMTPSKDAYATNSIRVTSRPNYSYSTFNPAPPSGLEGYPLWAVSGKQAHCLAYPVFDGCPCSEVQDVTLEMPLLLTAIDPLIALELGATKSVSELTHACSGGACLFPEEPGSERSTFPAAWRISASCAIDVQANWQRGRGR